MKQKRRSVLWSAVSLAATGLAGVLVTQQGRSEQMRRLRGKVVLITGGSRGLGFALARELRARGCHLVLVARNLVELERAQGRLITEVSAPEASVMVIPADVSQPNEVRRAVEVANDRFGYIDAVINNAGVILVGPLEGQSLVSFQQAMNINFFGALHTTLAVLPQMLDRGHGSIVNIASIGGKVAFPHLLPYAASKFALAGWSQGLRAELAGKGIHVTTVVPGIMRTGSHIQARYTGASAAEYRWFASAASFPGTAASAAAAARKIVRALVWNRAEVAIGMQALLASRLSSVVPEWTAEGLRAANQLLPEYPPDQALDFWGKDRSLAGSNFRGTLAEPLERLGTGSMRRFNQTTDSGR